jgi:hypothetical protein
LGHAASIKEIEIWWPVSGSRQRFRDVPLDKTFHVLEGRDVLDPITQKPFEIGKTKIVLSRQEHDR